MKYLSLGERLHLAGAVHGSEFEIEEQEEKAGVINRLDCQSVPSVARLTVLKSDPAKKSQ